MINDTKTEVLIINTRHQLAKMSIDFIDVDDSVIKPLESVRNLGTWFDCHMSMEVHVGNSCSKAFRGLYKIRQIRKYLTPESTKTLLHVLVTSHLDYCNSLLFGLPKYQLDRLQKILSDATRVIYQIPKLYHITPALVNSTGSQKSLKFTLSCLFSSITLLTTKHQNT